MGRLDKTLKLVLLGIWIVVALGLLGALIYGISGGEGVWDRFTGFADGKGSSKMVKQESLSIEGISSLVFQTESDSVLISASEDDKMHIRQYGKSDEEKYLYKLEKTKDTVTVTRKTRKISFFNFSFGFSHPRLEIEVPAGYTGDLLVKTISGEMGLNGDWTLGEVKFATTSGDLILKGSVKSDSFTASSVSGELFIADVTAETVNLSTTSGDVVAEHIGGSGRTSTVSGEVMMKALEGAMDIKTTSGDVVLRNFAPTGRMTISTVSGEVGLWLVQNVDKSFSVKTLSGDLSSDVAVVSGKRGGDADIAISTTSGDVLIRQ